MPHDRHTDSNEAKEVKRLGKPALLNLVVDWVSPFPAPVVTEHQTPKGVKVKVVRDDLLQFGTKARAGAALLHQPEFKSQSTLVYVLPKAGWAGLSLAALGKLYGKRVILFCPASAAATRHQLAAWHAGAELRWVRIAAMPNLNKLAQAFAEQRGYAFIPFGLSHPAAVAGLAKEASRTGLNPKEVWCACSTGVLTRGLQLAWPRADHHVVAVSRNIQHGEKGLATIHSHPLPFLRPVYPQWQPPYPTCLAYDGKVWEPMCKGHTTPHPVVWNVAGEVDWELPKQTFVSARAWGDMTDYNRP